MMLWLSEVLPEVISIANLQESYRESPLGELHLYLGKLLAVYALLVLGGALSLALLFVWQIQFWEHADVIYLLNINIKKFAGAAMLVNWIPALLLGSLWSKGVISRA